MNMLSKYENMHRSGTFYTSICINNHVNNSISCMLSNPPLTYLGNPRMLSLISYGKME